MTIFKKILIGLGIVAVCGAGLFGVIQFLTSGLTDTADDFLQAMRAGNLQKASSYLSAEFKHNTSSSQLQSVARRTGLDRYKSVSWGNRSVSTASGTSRGELDGEMTTPMAQNCRS